MSGIDFYETSVGPEGVIFGQEVATLCGVVGNQSEAYKPLDPPISRLLGFFKRYWLAGK